jgi:hypothetical protein
VINVAAVRVDALPDWLESALEGRSSAAALMRAPAVSLPPRSSAFTAELHTGVLPIVEPAASQPSRYHYFEYAQGRVDGTLTQLGQTYGVTHNSTFQVGGVPANLTINGSSFQTDVSTGRTLCTFSTVLNSSSAVTSPVVVGSTAEFWLADAPQVAPALAPPLASELRKRIDAGRVAATIDPDARELADAAVRDAKRVVDHAKLRGEPRVMFTDDGILTLQWQRGDYGVALLFAGDGEVSIAFKKPAQFYAQNGINVKVTENLPSAFYDALTQILG